MMDGKGKGPGILVALLGKRKSPEPSPGSKWGGGEESEDESEGEEEASYDDALREGAQALIDALKSGDADKVAEAFSSMHSTCAANEE